MKRIAFIEDAFTGSTLPLAKQFCKDGYIVDIYYLRNSIKEPEGTNCEYNASKDRITAIPDEQLYEIRKYIGSNNINIYLVRLMRPFESVPFLRNIAGCIMNRHLKQMAEFIDSKNYVFVNIVANYNNKRFTNIILYLKSKTILSLHEVWNHYNPSTTPSRLLHTAIKKGTDIVVFSQNSYNDILKIEGINREKVSVIPFGLFESYGSLNPTAPKEPLPQRYFLFYGYMVPYKGLSLIKEAVDILGENLQDYKIVLAGRGNDPVLQQVADDKRFVTIPRFISNTELAFLIRNAYAILCPYKTVSQSGIPQTAFVFNTPIIASDLNGFKEIINEDNGIFFKCNDAKGLADAMLRLINDNSLRNKLSDNIKAFDINHPVFNWNNIRKLYDRFMG
ncbi:MAG: glycosyltransferase family 4 protein [Prevotella sp.]|nr:glycosyltransferase family 4 protein [Prevotella sp.]MBQ8628319.1 glycosyltransferase family 4 protein [Prevotella sp.]